MQPQPHDAKRRVIYFLAGTFGLSLVLWVLIGLSDVSQAPGQFLFVPLMWTPGVIGLAVAFWFQRSLRGLGWKPGKPVYYLIGVVLPLAYSLAIYGSAWLLGLGGLDLRALGDNLPMALVKVFTIGLALSVVFATGEEIGWRGLLVPQLSRRYSFGRLALVSGIIWGFWHVPLILFGGYNSGTPLAYTIICFLITVTGASFVYAWLRLASGSVWPVALMHGVHNLFVQGVMDEITVNTGNTYYFTTEFGLFMAIAAVVLAVVFWRIGVPAGPAARPRSEDVAPVA